VTTEKKESLQPLFQLPKFFLVKNVTQILIILIPIAVIFFIYFSITKKLIVFSSSYFSKFYYDVYILCKTLQM